jgi:hypothetical protein
MASIRVAFALVTLGALLWVYCGAALIARAARGFFPERGRGIVLVFLASLLGSLYLLFLALVNPLLAMECALLVSLVPAALISSSLIPRGANLDMRDTAIQAGQEALILGVLILALSLIREPIGFGSLSVPGGARGMVELFHGAAAFFPIRIISSSAGAFLLLGYGIALFRRFKNRITREEEPL